VHSGLTPLELAFRELIAGIRTPSGRVEINPKYSLDCAEARARWEAEHPEHCAEVRKHRS
jgi:hypothetical protein